MVILTQKVFYLGVEALYKRHWKFGNCRVERNNTFHVITVKVLCIECSGPKRYDVIDGRWRYSHDGEALHDLLQKEFSEILDTEVDLSQLRHSYLVSDEGNWAN